MKQWKAINILFLMGVVFLLSEMTVVASEDTAVKNFLIVYYSRTGNTRAACEALQKELSADILEIKDLKDRSGGWGFFTGAIGSLFGTHTKIDPAHPDLAAYDAVIIGSPIWAGKLSTAIRTFIAQNRFDGKKVILFTTTNVLEKEGAHNKAKKMVRESGGDAAGYYQIAVREKIDGRKVEKTKEQIASEACGLAAHIQKTF